MRLSPNPRPPPLRPCPDCARGCTPSPLRRASRALRSPAPSRHAFLSAGSKSRHLDRDSCDSSALAPMSNPTTTGPILPQPSHSTLYSSYPSILRDEPSDEAGGHVATADESDVRIAHSGHRAVASMCSRHYGALMRGRNPRPRPGTGNPWGRGSPDLNQGSCGVPPGSAGSVRLRQITEPTLSTSGRQVHRHSLASRPQACTCSSGRDARAPGNPVRMPREILGDRCLPLRHNGQAATGDARHVDPRSRARVPIHRGVLGIVTRDQVDTAMAILDQALTECVNR